MERREQKPCWDEEKRLLSAMYEYSWRWATFSTSFGKAGTMEIGLKFEASDGLPDLWIGCTMECFQESGNSQDVRQVLRMCRMMWPIVSKQSLITVMQIPSDSQAPEFFHRKENRTERVDSHGFQRESTGTNPG